MKNFYFPVLQFLCLLSLVSGQGSSISFSPDSSLCIGEEVEMICFVESSVQFGEDDAQVSINSSVPFPISQLVSNATVDGIDLSRYSANFDGLSISLSRPGIRLIINSYQPSDSATVFGCHGEFMDFTVSPVLVSGQPNPSAAPPSAPSLQSSVSNFNTTTCSADISLSWNTPPSNRAVDRYFLYLDGYPLATTNSDSYIHSTILNINTDYQYSVTAMSCAGNSTASSSNVNSVATPPSAPSLQSSVSNFNTATCSADISLSWNNLPSNRTVDRYFLYLDGSPLATVNSNSYIHSTILKINTDYQYSVTAMNCAGNSTTSSSNVNSVASYSLMKCFQSTCLDYNNTITGEFTVNWTLSTSTQPSGLDITYSLQLLYSHSRQDVTYTYTDSTNFTLPSSQLSYNTVLTAHNFTQLDGVETNITANLTIVQQCGQSFSGTVMEYTFIANQANKIVIPAILSAFSAVLVLIFVV